MIYVPKQTNYKNILTHETWASDEMWNYVIIKVPHYIWQSNEEF
jgi:hypothetical protein